MVRGKHDQKRLEPHVFELVEMVSDARRAPTRIDAIADDVCV
jgi:hypothetical protein